MNHEKLNIVSSGIQINHEIAYCGGNLGIHSYGSSQTNFRFPVDFDRKIPFRGGATKSTGRTRNIYHSADY